jgi:hypothetical protein
MRIAEFWALPIKIRERNGSGDGDKINVNIKKIRDGFSTDGLYVCVIVSYC